MSGVVERAVAALTAGELVVLPTDTVYGLAAVAHSEEAARRLYALKGRSEIQPTAVVAAGVEALLAAVPELPERAAVLARALLPGPYTLVLPNPGRRFSWLNGPRPETIGVRVPALTGSAAAVVERVGLIVTTSANLAGEPDPCTAADVSPAVRGGVAVVIDGGRLPGVPSTVIDLTGTHSAVLRAGAGDVDEALARVEAVSR